MAFEPCVEWFLMVYWMLIDFVAFTCVCKFNLQLLVWVLTREVLYKLCVSHTYVLHLIVRCSSGVGTWKWGTRKLFFPVFLNQTKTSFLSADNSEAYTQVFIEKILCLSLSVHFLCIYCVCAFCLCLCLWLLLLLWLSVSVPVHFVRVRVCTVSVYAFCYVCVCVRAFFLCL